MHVVYIAMNYDTKKLQTIIAISQQIGLTDIPSYVFPEAANQAET